MAGFQAPNMRSKMTPQKKKTQSMVAKRLPNSNLRETAGPDMKGMKQPAKANLSKNSAKMEQFRNWFQNKQALAGDKKKAGK
jgi:hypothetical protein